MSLILRPRPQGDPNNTELYGSQAIKPGKPTLTVMPGNTENVIAWTDGFDGGAAIISRKLYRSTTSSFIPGPANLLTGDPGESPYTDNDVTNGQNYFYRMVVTNSKGDSPASDVASGQPAPTVPAAPSISATGGNSQNSIGWVDGDNGGASITSHRIYRSVTIDFDVGPTNLIATVTSAPPYIDTTAQNGVTYYYRVVAVNNSGASAPSVEAAAIATANAPAAPTATLTAGTMLSLAWTDGADGGAAISAHKIYRSTSAGFTPAPENLLATVSSASPYVDVSAIAGTIYYYRLSAVNAAGEGDFSNQVTGSATTVPAAPTASVSPGNTQNSVAWVDNGTGGSSIMGHAIYRSTTSGFTPAPSNLIATVSSASPYVDSGLSNGTTYYYRICAINAIGASAASTQVSGTPQAVVPSAPTISAAAGINQILLSWTDGASGGAPITSYKVYRSTTNNFTPGPTNLIDTITGASPYNDTTASAGVTYYYRMTAINSTGEGAASNQSSAVPLAAPTAPAAPTITVTAGNGQNVIAWTDGSNGGATITAHKIYRSTTDGFTPGSGNLVTTVSTASPYTDEGLANGTTYYYRVTAVNSVGEGAASNQDFGRTSSPLSTTQYARWGYYPQIPEGTPPYAWTSTGDALPSWLTLAQHTGALTGYADTQGVWNIVLTRTDRAGVVVNLAIPLTVNAPTPFALSQLPSDSYVDWDAAEGVTLDTGTVSVWSPKHGLGDFVTAAAADRPSVVADYFGSGKPAILGNGLAAGNLMTGGAAFVERAWNFFVAARGSGSQEGTAAPKTVFRGSRASDSRTYGIALLRPTNDPTQNQIYAFQGGSGNTTGGVAGSFAPSIPHILTHTLDAQIQNTTTLRVDGAVVGTGSLTSTGTGSTELLFGSGTSGGKAKVYIGRRVRVDATKIPGDTASSWNRKIIEGALAWEYGLQGNLPSDHPLKNRSPVSTDYKPYNLNVGIWGNSLGNGVGGQLSNVFTGDFTNYNGGVGGSTSSQIKTRFDSGIDSGGASQTDSGWSATQKRTRCLIFWELWENDGNASIPDATRKQNLVDMVTACEAALGVSAGQAKTILIGTKWKGNGNAGSTGSASFDQWIKDTFPNYWVDVVQGLCNLAAPGTAYADGTAYAANRIPPGLRIDSSDTVHLNTTGYAEAAKIFLQAAISRGIR